MITLTDLRKVYPTPRAGVVALDGIDLHVEPGSIHGIVGPSGAGKSTLIRCITALERPTSGSVVIDGKELTTLPTRQLRQARRRIGMVFQHVNLFDNRTAMDNVAYPLRIAGVPRSERRRRAQELLGLVGLADRDRAYPAELSGGQIQRVGIARALAADPAVLLCDEPSSALDWDTTRQILELIGQVRDRLGVTVLIITHEMSVVRQACDSVTLLASGRVVQQGSIGEVIADHSTQLARDLIPLAAAPIGTERAQLEVSYTSTRVPTPQVLSTIAELGEEVTITAGTIETLAEQRVGRFQLDVPRAGRDQVIERLHHLGVHVEITQ